MESYTAKKEKLVAGLKGAKEGKISLGKRSSNLFRPKAHAASDTAINVRDFNEVISIDTAARTAEVEAMTPYDSLVAETLKHGLLPTVVPELKGITIGGALAGCGIESSSFRYGLVHETISSSELLLSDGTTLVADSVNGHSDLFAAFPNSYGTLGYSLKVNVKLIPAKPYLQLTHHHFSSPHSFFGAMERLCKEKRAAAEDSYIDGVIFGPASFAITCAEFVDEAPWVSDYRYMQIYYKSIESRECDYLTASDYIWRWDPDWFWCSKVFGMQNPLLRLLLGKFMLSSRVYGKAMHFFKKRLLLQKLFAAAEGRREWIIQDVAIPVGRAAEFLSFFEKEIGITPVWICPAQAYDPLRHYTFCPMDPTLLYLDFGFWDSVPTTFPDGHYNRKIEAKVRELGGFKSLYSSCYYSEEEFWSLYDRGKYQALKKKYDPSERLRDLYAKCTTRQ